MKIVDVCKNYFSGFKDLGNFSANDAKKNAFAFLKVLSYFTVVIPLGFAGAYGISSLAGRVKKDAPLNGSSKIVNAQAVNLMNSGNKSDPWEKRPCRISLPSVDLP